MNITTHNKNLKLFTVITFLLGATLSANAQTTTVLYDASSGITLNSAPWAWGYTALPPGTTPTFSSGTTNLNTTANNNISAGFAQLSPLPLDRNAGYSLRFDIQVVSESHSNTNRAGTSIIVLGDDLQGIELGFWTNEVWAQSDNPLFTHAEGVAFNTTNLTRYDLNILGNNYTLLANGSQILTGSLRNYTAFAGLIDPYETQRFLFLGDNTTSANANVNIGYASVTSVPEPNAFIFVASLATIGVIFKRRKTRNNLK